MNAVTVSRRDVLASAPLFAAALMRCTHAIADRTRFAEAFIVDPSWQSYRPILRGVITAVLPFGAAGFPPITPEIVEQRLIDLFPLEHELRFLGLQRTIVLFDQLDLFPSFGGPLAQEESKARDLVARGIDEKPVMREIAAADDAAFRTFIRQHAIDPRTARFHTLPLDTRRAYLRLWENSASIIKRQFYSSMRSVVMVTTYSMDAVWPSIGYAGPLVPRTLPRTVREP
jgi:hypothetical protein